MSSFILKTQLAIICTCRGDIEPLVSVLSAEISMSSLMEDMDAAFGGGFCGVSNTE